MYFILPPALQFSPVQQSRMHASTDLALKRDLMASSQVAFLSTTNVTTHSLTTLLDTLLIDLPVLDYAHNSLFPCYRVV